MRRFLLLRSAQSGDANRQRSEVEVIQDSTTKNSDNTSVLIYLETLSVFLLTLATVCTSIALWQSSRWGGEQSIRFSKSSAERVESGKSVSRGVQQLSYDAGVFIQLAEALLEQDDILIVLGTSTAQKKAAAELRTRY